MRSYQEIKNEIRETKKKIANAERSRANPQSLVWLRGYITALSWILEK